MLSVIHLEQLPLKLECCRLFGFLVIMFKSINNFLFTVESAWLLCMRSFLHKDRPAVCTLKPYSPINVVLLKLKQQTAWKYFDFLLSFVQSKQSNERVSSVRLNDI